MARNRGEKMRAKREERASLVRHLKARGIEVVESKAKRKSAKRPKKNPPVPESKEERIARMLEKGLTPGNPGNSGGKKGRSGRPRGTWREWAGKVIASPRARQAQRRVVHNESHPAYATLTKLLVEQSLGKAPQTMEVKGNLTLEALVGAAQLDTEE